MVCPKSDDSRMNCQTRSQTTRHFRIRDTAMKLQAITMIAVLTAFAGTSTTTVEANDFIKVIRTINAIDHAVNGPKFNGPKFGPKPIHHPIHKPIILPHPGHGHIHPKPPVCKPPIVKPQVHICHKYHSHICHCHKPPINKPPMKKFTMKLMNNAETKIFFSLNGLDYQMMQADDVELVKSVSPKDHLIKYHNGVEVVEFQLDPTAAYSFEWEGETLMLLQLQG